MSEPVEVISAFVSNLVGRPVGLTEPIISSRLLESIAAVQLVDFVERELAVEISDSNLILENFDSVAAIARFVGAQGVLDAH